MNTELLAEFLDNSGFKKTWIAKQMNISYPTFNKKISKVTEFSNSEIGNFCKLLKISTEDRDRIFFSDFVEFNSTSIT